jgi:hypothetical protein
MRRVFNHPCPTMKPPVRRSLIMSFDDHPPERRFAGRIDTVTVDAVFAFVRGRGMGQTPLVVR